MDLKQRMTATVMIPLGLKAATSAVMTENDKHALDLVVAVANLLRALIDNDPKRWTDTIPILNAMAREIGAQEIDITQAPKNFPLDESRPVFGEVKER